MNEFLEQFLLEARELAEQATGELLALERAPDSKEHLDGAFRAFHTLKGGAGIVDFSAMSRAVHAAESVLTMVRAGELQISADLTGDCLACIDQIIQWLDEIQATGDLPTAADHAADAIVARFGDAEDPATRSPTPSTPERKREGGTIAAVAHRILNEQRLLLAAPHPVGRQGRTVSAARVVLNIRQHLSLADGTIVEQAASNVLGGGDPQQLIDAIISSLAVGQAVAETAAPTSPRKETATQTLRVSSERVNALVNLIGELIIAKNAITHLSRLAADAENPLATALKDEQARLERLTAGLQHAVLSLRVLPLRTVFQRFSRVVRELAVSLEKPTSLVLEGEGTEADKAIVEMLFEPLLHIVRNAMDHGIETQAARAAVGKPTVATVRMRGYRTGDHVVIEVMDDGQGIDIQRVRQVAVERGIVGQDDLSTVRDEDAIDLLFASGFSTAAAVTDLSGRGVGMDAVRTAVERIGGRVTMESKSGQGSTVRFVLPFSVMMTQVMTVDAGGQTFGVPLEAVVETVRIPRDRIQAIGHTGAFVVRNRTIPLINLALTLGQQAGVTGTQEAIVVIASVSGQLAGFEVERVGERMDVMLRPVDGLLSGMPGIAGTTLMGDGQVLLILDLQEILA
jgi:two-component system chemotaxis sensor kinase CheA